MLHVTLIRWFAGEGDDNEIAVVDNYEMINDGRKDETKDNLGHW